MNPIEIHLLLGDTALLSPHRPTTAELASMLGGHLRPLGSDWAKSGLAQHDHNFLLDAEDANRIEAAAYVLATDYSIESPLLVLSGLLDPDARAGNFAALAALTQALLRQEADPRFQLHILAPPGESAPDIPALAAALQDAGTPAEPGEPAVIWPAPDAPGAASLSLNHLIARIASAVAARLGRQGLAAESPERLRLACDRVLSAWRAHGLAPAPDMAPADLAPAVLAALLAMPSRGTGAV